MWSGSEREWLGVKNVESCEELGGSIRALEGRDRESEREGVGVLGDESREEVESVGKRTGGTRWLVEQF